MTCRPRRRPYWPRCPFFGPRLKTIISSKSVLEGDVICAWERYKMKTVLWPLRMVYRHIFPFTVNLGTEKPSTVDRGRTATLFFTELNSVPSIVPCCRGDHSIASLKFAKSKTTKTFGSSVFFPCQKETFHLQHDLLHLQQVKVSYTPEYHPSCGRNICRWSLVSLP